MSECMHPVVVHPHNPIYFNRPDVGFATKGFFKAAVLLINNGMIPRPRSSRHCLEMLQQHAELIEEVIENSKQSTIRTIVLSVYHKGHRVCFNCLKRFTSRHPATRHHLLPRRFRGMPFYSNQEPIVEVHKRCTRYYHKHYDPFRPKLIIWSGKRYLQVARRVSFGFALLCKDKSILESPELTMHPNLAPYIVGQADFQTPNLIDLSIRYPQPISYTELLQVS